MNFTVARRMQVEISDLKLMIRTRGESKPLKMEERLSTLSVKTLYSSCHGIFHLFDLEMISTSIHESRDVSTLQNIIFIKIMKSYFPFY